MPPSKLDAIYRSLLLTKFFTKGWGKPENLQRLFEFRKVISNRETCFKLVPRDYPVEIVKEEVTSDCRIIDGKFTTPLELYLPGLVPKCAQDAHFQIILPLEWKDPKGHKPMCIHLAGTGDHYFWRRRNFIAKPLIREANMGAILLENPFYGLRKPKDQRASSLHNVSDIFVMGGCLVLESLVLLHWCERNGYGPLGITGLSMGGHMASLAATNWPKPLVLVPCLSWSTASAVFTEGVMAQSINWDALETQYFADGMYRERLFKMVTIIDEAFRAGQRFVKSFRESVQGLKQDISDMSTIASGEAAVQPVTLSIAQEPSPSPAPTVSTVQKTRIDLNRHRTMLNLSDSLLAKLLSPEKNELTDNEVNELNVKIKLALLRLKEETQAVASEESSKEALVLQSDTAPAESQSQSIIEVGRTKLMSLLSPSSAPAAAATTSNPPAVVREKLDISKTNWWERETLQFMRGMMDECTHLKNFSVPYDTSLIIAVCAKDDAYVPREGCTSLEELWPGSEVRYLDGGHVSAFVLHQRLFRQSIIEAFERAKRLHEQQEEDGNDVNAKQPAQMDRATQLAMERIAFAEKIKEMLVLKP